MRNKSKTIGYLHLIDGCPATWVERQGMVIISRAVALEPDLKTLYEHQSMSARRSKNWTLTYGYRRVVA